MHRNNALLVKKIGALVGKYNLLAAERGMQKIPYPSYGSVVNDISRSLLVRDLKAIGKAVKKIEEVPVVDEEIEEEEDIGGGEEEDAGGEEEDTGGEEEDIVFTDGKFSRGIWTYTIISGTNTVSAALNANSLTEAFNGESVTLGVADMPYEKLVTSNGIEFSTVSYERAFMALPSTVKELTIENWTNTNVVNVSYMFSGCSALTSLDLSNFNTEKVENMADMFSGCSALTELDLSGFNTELVENMASMFYGCRSLMALDLSNWTVSNNVSIENMFYDCLALTRIKISKTGAGLLSTFPPPAIIANKWRVVMTDTQTELTSSEWNTDWGTGVKKFVRYPIPGDKTLADVEISNNTPYTKDIWTYTLGDAGIRLSIKADALTDKISGDGSLTLTYEDMPYEKLVTTGGTTYVTMSYQDAFSSLPETVTALTIDGWTNDTTDDMNDMFSGCGTLESISFTGFDTSGVEDMSEMFAGCSELTSLNLSSFNTALVTNMADMFSGCSGLTELTLGENFVVPDNYGDEETITQLSPSAECTITMNETMYNAFKQYDLNGFTFNPNTWNEDGEAVQDITVTPSE